LLVPGIRLLRIRQKMGILYILEHKTAPLVIFSRKQEFGDTISISNADMLSIVAMGGGYGQITGCRVRVHFLRAILMT